MVAREGPRLRADRAVRRQGHSRGLRQVGRRRHAPEAGAARARQGRHDALLRHLGRLQPRRAAQGVSRPAKAGGDAGEHGEEVGGAESQGQVTRRTLYPYATVMPVLLVVALFTVYPLLHSVYLSLHENVLTRPLDNDFVGLQNFREVVTGYYFWRSLWSTAVFAVMAVGAVTLYGLGVAPPLNQVVLGTALLKVVGLLPRANPPLLRA